MPSNPVLVDRQSRRPVAPMDVRAADGRPLALSELEWIDRADLPSESASAPAARNSAQGLFPGSLPLPEMAAMPIRTTRTTPRMTAVEPPSSSSSSSWKKLTPLSGAAARARLSDEARVRRNGR